MMTEKSWLEVEMEESVTLLRKKLEEMNDIEPKHLDYHDIEAIKNIYKSLYYIHCIKKA